MNLKIAVCDDDSSQRSYLAGILSRWVERNHHLIEVKQYADAKQFFFDYDEEKDFDILLLDIEMPGGNGIEVARRVRRENTAVQIIFITGYYEYFSDGFDVSALHYLIKPVDERKLCTVLDRAADNLGYRQRSVLVSTPEEEVKVSLADICYLEAENVYVNVHTVRGVYRTRSSLAKFITQLDNTFVKVHRSYVVALNYVRKISRSEITMQNGETIPISRGMYDAVHDALIKYL